MRKLTLPEWANVAEVIASIVIVASVSIMRTTGARQWWAGWRSIMPDDVVKYVDSTLDDPSIKVGLLNEEVPWLFAILKMSRTPVQDLNNHKDTI